MQALRSLQLKGKTMQKYTYKLSVLDKFADKIKYGFSEKSGGVSEGCYASLNLGLHVGDDKTKVIENRKRFCSFCQTDLRRAVCCEQVHGTNIHKVTKKDAGRGAFSLQDTIKNTDGLITNEKNIPLLLFFADCTPLLLYDAKNNAVALVHAGWRGTVGNIAGAALQAMHDAYGTNAADCVAGIGPHIGKCCYEVGPEVAEKFLSLFSSSIFSAETRDAIITQNSDNYYLSLYEANKALLLRQGVKEKNISAEQCCTSCNSDRFYSYRAEHGKTGRHAALLCLK